MKKILLTIMVLAAFSFGSSNLFAQCAAGEDEISITVRLDDFPFETDWELVDGLTGTVVASRSFNFGDDFLTFTDKVCVPASGCYVFRITDSFGDGICCTYGQGFYDVRVNGTTLTGKVFFDDSEDVVNIGGPCAPNIPDDCADADAITCGDVATGSTSAATSDSGLPFCGTSVSSSNKGVWYTWTGDGSCVNLSLANSNYDTKLNVYSGSCGSLTCVDGDDDGGPGLTSELQFVSVAGTQYYFLVHGFLSNSGNYELAMSCSSAPANAMCAGAIMIAPGGTASGNTDCSGFDNVGFCGTSNTSDGVWYTATGTGGLMTATTAGSSYDTKLTVLSGTCSNLACVDGDDDGGPGLTSEVSWCSEAGETYYILVHGFSSNTGDYDLALSSGDPLVADAGDCQTRFVGYAPIEADTNWLVASASGGTAPYTFQWAEAGLGSSLDGSGLAVQPAATTTYNVTVTDANGCTATSTVTVQVVDVECGNKGGKVSICHVPPGNPANAQTLCISSNALGAHIGDHGGDYYGPCGNTCLATNESFELLPPVPAGADECADAGYLVCGSVASGSTVGTGNDNVPFCGTSNGSGGGVWYKIEGNGGSITVTTCEAGTDFDTKLRVYTGSCGSLTCVGGDDDDFNCSLSSRRSVVTWSSVAGQDYYILVHGFSSNEGNYEMSVSCGSNKMGDMAEAMADPYVKAFPNPTSGNATFEFNTAESGNATVEIFNVAGTRIATVFNGQVEAGVINKVDFNGSNIANGLYIYRMTQSNGKILHGKLQVMR